MTREADSDVSLSLIFASVLSLDHGIKSLCCVEITITDAKRAVLAGIIMK